ncbi:MAG: DUF2922 domain-containing protein [Defluviitaleaceae bacterium]|nr:DUF2922 domain-containing protein [Defluviitaleaceae bacterium]
MATSTHRFVLRFNTDSGRILRFSVPHARTDKIAADARLRMDAMASSGILLSQNGIAENAYSAKVITTAQRTVAPL